MKLAVVEGEEEVGLVRELSRQHVPVGVGSVVVVGLVIANSWHESHVRGKFLT